MKKVGLFGAILVVSSLAKAATWKSTSYVDITNIYAVDQGLAFFTTHVDTALSTCDSGKRFLLLKEGPNYDLKASVLMAAFFANKQILFRYDSSQSATCSPAVNRFLVKP